MKTLIATIAIFLFLFPAFAQQADEERTISEISLLQKEPIPFARHLVCASRGDVEDILRVNPGKESELVIRKLKDNGCIVGGRDAKVRMVRPVGWSSWGFEGFFCELQVELFAGRSQKPNSRFKYIAWNVASFELLRLCRRISDI
jgi:hypothetical protein